MVKKYYMKERRADASCFLCIYLPCPIRPEHSHILEYLIIRTNTACRVRGGKHKNVVLRDHSCCIEKQ